MDRGGVLLLGLNLPFVEVGDSICEKEGNVGGPVEGFVDDKRDDSFELIFGKCVGDKPPGRLHDGNAGHCEDQILLSAKTGVSFHTLFGSFFPSPLRRFLLHCSAGIPVQGLFWSLLRSEMCRKG